MTTFASGRRRRASRISISRASSPRRRSPVRTPFIPAMDFSPRTPSSPRPASRRTSTLSDRRRRKSAPWVTRPPRGRPCTKSECPSFQERRAVSKTRTKHSSLPATSASPSSSRPQPAAAVNGANAIDYVGAGTIEMLLNEDRSFYFMEMNTRIQVEHPVTEMLTGIDLVKEQILVAAGARLSVKPPIERRGHVIECRVNAEDPARNFQPSPGHIDVFHPPGGPGVRLDTHVYAGYSVPPFYDSLLAKLICQGRDRQEALRRMQVALESFIIEGVTTTIPFLGRVMANKKFQEGAVDTKFLERESELMKEPASAA